MQDIYQFVSVSELPVDKVGGHEDNAGLGGRHPIQRVEKAAEGQPAHPLVGHRVWGEHRT